jgi:uncharacterized protein YjiS (DUF1127 family)
MSATSTALRRTRIGWPRLSARGVFDRFAAADALYRERHNLASLDDRMLRDVGLNRGNVAAELRRPLRW